MGWITATYHFKQLQRQFKREIMIYADPGSGILIWQLLLAIFFGATFYFTKLRHWAIAKIRPERTNVPHESATDSPAPKPLSDKL